MTAEIKNRNPYPGPRPFEREEQRLFFGREREVRELRSLITAHRAVLLYAQSGAGKTSLLNAGLIPSLTKEEFEILPVARVRGFEPEDIDLKGIPNIYVFNTLVGWAGDNVGPRSLVSTSIVTFLEEREHLMDEQGLPLPRVAIFDQFEELFTSYPGRWKERGDFFSQVVEALEADPLLRVLFVIREDYLASLDSYVDFLPERLRTRCRLERLRADAACQAVEGPLRDTECSFAPGVASCLVQQFLNIRVKSAAGEVVEAVGEYIEPVQLQVVCQSLWLNLPRKVTVVTSDHLQEFGDVEEALRTFYERTIEIAKRETGVSEGDLRHWFNDKLITTAGTRGTVFQGKEQTEGIPNSAVDKLETQHIIRAEMRAGARWYELTHDQLIKPIRKSNKVWFEHQRAEEQQRQIETARRRARVEEQAKSAKLFRRLTAVLAVMVVVTIVAAVFAFLQLRVAKKERDDTKLALMASKKDRKVAQHAQMVAKKRQEEALVAQADTQKAIVIAGDFQKLTKGVVKLPEETNSIGMKLVSIPAGSFMMGSSSSAKQLADEYKKIDPNMTEENFQDEFPQHNVLISKGFWMGQTEVTQGQYKSVMNAEPWSKQKWVQEDADNPAIYVNWDKAVEFCMKLSQREGKTYRLPTEAEWEYACRAGTTNRFSFGDSDLSLDDYAWYRSNAYEVGQKYAHRVGQKKPNRWVLYDMHGNVWEWCSDYYDPNYYYSRTLVDPKGPSSGTYRSLRGGSWPNVQGYLRCSERYYIPTPDFRNDGIGFRVVRQPKTHSLTATAVNGSVTKSPDRAGYNHGETVTLEAVPKPGYSFTNWSGDLSGSTNPATLFMDADKSVTASFALKKGSVVTHTGWIHRGCVEFRDKEDDISKGPITRVKVFYSGSGYIYGLQLYYDGYGGWVFGFHDFKDTDVKLDVGEFFVPPGDWIVRVEGQIEKYYISRLRFITNRGKASKWFGGRQGTPFTAYKNGLPLRTISGWVNLRRHPSLNRAITSMTFHFGPEGR